MIVAAKGGGGVPVRVKRQSLAPAVSRYPVRMGVLSALKIVTVVLLKYAEQSASHSFPMLTRLFVKPGMTCPCLAAGGRPGRGRSAVAEEDVCCPVAVLTVVPGAAVLTEVTGALGMK